VITDQKPDVRNQRPDAQGSRGRFTLRRRRRRVQEVVQNLGLHALDFEAVTARDAVELLQAG
jgi:hypothetical protein